MHGSSSETPASASGSRQPGNQQVIRDAAASAIVNVKHIVAFNVGGKRFEVRRSLLERHPDTFLAKLVTDQWMSVGSAVGTNVDIEPLVPTEGNYTAKTKSRSVVDSTNGIIEIDFLDNDPELFRHILQYYRHSEIVIPTSISIEEMKREALFFALPGDCYIGYRSKVVDQAESGDKTIDIVGLKRQCEALFVEWYGAEAVLQIVNNLCGGNQIVGTGEQTYRKWTMSERNVEIDATAWAKKRIGTVDGCAEEVLQRCNELGLRVNSSPTLHTQSARVFHIRLPPFRYRSEGRRPPPQSFSRGFEEERVESGPREEEREANDTRGEGTSTAHLCRRIVRRGPEGTHVLDCEFNGDKIYESDSSNSEEYQRSATLVPMSADEDPEIVRREGSDAHACDERGGRALKRPRN